MPTKAKTAGDETMPKDKPAKKKAADSSAAPAKKTAKAKTVKTAAEKKPKAKAAKKEKAPETAASAEETKAAEPRKTKTPKKTTAKAKKAEVVETEKTAPAADAVRPHPVKPAVTHEPKAPKEIKPAPEHKIKHEISKPEVKAAPAPVVLPKETPKQAPAVSQPAAPPAPAAPPPAPVVAFKGEITVNETSTVRDLADKMNLKPGDILKKLLGMGSLATINQRLDLDTATILAHEFGYNIKHVPLYAEVELEEEKEDPAKLVQRPPVVTIMGHVDHGKTSLLDAIRKSKVAEGEAGGITQHIGAYKVKTPKGDIAFLDTPGHEAFTAMRSRGAKATDIVVLVVSATDGIMPQTVEAIDHARAASVPIIVAINKIDLPTANPAQVKQELSTYNLVSEDWGGDTITVEVSAKRNQNIDQLLEMILLKAEMMELKANPHKLARGVVIEGKLDTKRGPVGTVLVQSGTLKIGDNFIVGRTSGKVRAMIDEHGQRHIEAPPSTPVEILGATETPQAGDQFVVVADERQAREISLARQQRLREDSLRPRHHLSLEDISTGMVKELRLILKADVQGSYGALKDSLERLSTTEINLRTIHGGVGAITESDVMLAAASDALIIGFNMRPDPI